MFAILPIAAFLSIFIILYNKRSDLSWRRAFIRSSIVWGIILAISTELLSLWYAINQLALVVIWIIPILVGVIQLIRLYKNGDTLRFPRIRLSKRVGDIILLVGYLYCVQQP